MKFPPSEFWNYSIDIYQHTSIEQACLKLQEQYRADVNILLYCCWVASKNIRLDNKDITTLIKTGQPWQSNILVHIRNARHTLKSSPVVIPEDERENAGKTISQMELNAEHMEQLALEKALNLKKKPRDKDLSTADCARHNLFHYCQQLETVNSSNSVQNEISQIIFALASDNGQDMQTLQVGSLVSP